MARDYYVILGVGADATPDQIRSAYRREAKRLHPDHSGEGCEPFQALQEAYEVLGNPRRRRAYDDELEHEQRMARQAARQARPEPLRRRRAPVEPLIPNERPRARGTTYQWSSYASPVEELFRSMMSDWDVQSRARARTEEAGEVHVQVSLTRAQALRGGRVRLWLPGQVRCPACGGRGWRGSFECAQCLGRGFVVDEVPVDIAFPGGLADGTEARVELSEPSVGDLTLVVHFRTGGW
jgi:molecular chaperone DnaJ